LLGAEFFKVLGLFQPAVSSPAPIVFQQLLQGLLVHDSGELTAKFCAV
jgi:hypothetical protein